MDKETKHSIDFINQKINKKDGFIIPDNYFDKLDDDLQIIVNQNSFPEEHNFEVPEMYFATLENEILFKIKTTNTLKPKVLSLRKKIIQYVPNAIAASVVLIIASYFYFNSNEVTTYNFNTTDIEDWFDEDYNIISSDDLAILFTADDFTEDELSVKINNDNLEEYLNTIDSSNLIEELQ